MSQADNGALQTRLAVVIRSVFSYVSSELCHCHIPLKILFETCVNDFALITDVTEIPESTLALMHGLKVLALDCLREKPHSTHLGFQQAVDYAKRIGAEMTYFIHMCHELEHVATEARLPSEIRLGYDGLELDRL